MSKNPLYRNADTTERNDRRDILIAGAALAVAEGGVAAAAVILSDVLGSTERLKAFADDVQPARRPAPAETEIGAADDGLRQTQAPDQTWRIEDAESEGRAIGLESVFSYDDGAARPASGGVSPSEQELNLKRFPIAGAPLHVTSAIDREGVSPFPAARPADHGSSSGTEGEAPHPPDGTKASWTLRLGTDDDNSVFGTAGDDYVFGRDGGDMLFGGAGNDRLLAGSGDDDVIGGAGDDFLVGGKGDDRLAGGVGDDVFIFRGGFGDDVVSDFNNRDERDLIELARSEFADFAAVEHALADTPAGVVLTHDDGSTLTLLHVFKAALSADDFHFVV